MPVFLFFVHYFFSEIVNSLCITYKIPWIDYSIFQFQQYYESIAIIAIINHISKMVKMRLREADSPPRQRSW